jgi:hypothetical protein
MARKISIYTYIYTGYSIYLSYIPQLYTPALYIYIHVYSYYLINHRIHLFFVCGAHRAAARVFHRLGECTLGFAAAPGPTQGRWIQVDRRGRVGSRGWVLTLKKTSAWKLKPRPLENHSKHKVIWDLVIKCRQNTLNMGSYSLGHFYPCFVFRCHGKASIPSSLPKKSEKGPCGHDCEKHVCKATYQNALQKDVRYWQAAPNGYSQEKMCQTVVYSVGVWLGWSRPGPNPQTLRPSCQTSSENFSAWSAWWGAETEVKTLHRLIKHARKRKLGGARISAMSSMDLLETIPMEFPADDIPQDCMVVCFLCTHIKRRMHKLFNASLDCLRFLDQSPFAQLLPRHTARTTSTMARSPMPMITVQQWPMRLMDSGLNGIYSGHFKSMGPPSVTNSKCLN